VTCRASLLLRSLHGACQGAVHVERLAAAPMAMAMAGMAMAMAGMAIAMAMAGMLMASAAYW